MAVPPLAEIERGFEEAALLLTRLATRAGAGLVLLAPHPQHEAIGAAFARARRRGAAPELLDLPAWKDLSDTLASMLRPADALALVSARRGAVAWRASLDRLPRVLVRRFPDLPLFVIYPGQAPVSVILPSGLTGEERGFVSRFRPKHIYLGLEPGPIDDLVRLTLAATLPVPARKAALRALLVAPHDACREIRAGVVLVHAHSDETETPRFAVGVNRTGLEVPGAAGAVFVVVLLAAPSRVPSATYLRWLGLIARMFRDDATVEALRMAENPEAARAILVHALHPREDPGPDTPHPGDAASPHFPSR